MSLLFPMALIKAWRHFWLSWLKERKRAVAPKETRWAAKLSTIHPSAPLAKNYPVIQLKMSVVPTLRNHVEVCSLWGMPQHPLLTSFFFYLLTFDGSKKNPARTGLLRTQIPPWLIFTQSSSHVCKILKMSVNAGFQTCIPLCKNFYIIKNSHCSATITQNTRWHKQEG